MVPLGELASDEGSAIAIGPFGSRMKTDNYVDSGVKVVRGLNITDAGGLAGEYVYVTEAFAAMLGTARLKADDIVLPHRGAIGRSALVPPGEYVMSTSLMRIRLDRSRAWPEYVTAFLCSDEGKREILQFASTVGTPGIGQPLASLRQMRVPLPPIEEQRRIAGVLGALDDLIDINHTLVRDLWSAAEAAFVATSARADVVPAGECIGLRYGKALPAQSRRPGTVTVVSSAGVVGSHDEALVTGPGVVVGRKGSVGTVTWVDRDFFPIDTAFSVQSELPAPYCYFALRQLGLEKMNTDSAVPGLNRSNALTRPFPRPTKQALAEFIGVVTPLIAAAKALDEEADEMIRTRDELLPLLLSGRVQVNASESLPV